MPSTKQTTTQRWVNDQTPDHPFGKNEGCEAFLDDVGARIRSLTPTT